MTANAAAAARGIFEGQPLSAATAFAPELKSCERNPRAERAALAAIGGAAYGFSSQVTCQAAAPAPPAAAVWLEIASSLHLFSGQERLTEQLQEKIAALGYEPHAGVGATLESAYLLAGSARGATDIRNAPVPALPISGDVVQALRGSGIRTLGELLQIPSDALARRFGPELPDYLGRLTGRLPDARRFYRVPPRFRRRFELAGAAETTEALRFPIKRLLAELAAYLTVRDTGVQSCTFAFAGDDGPPTPLTVNFSSPTRDPAHLQVVVQAQLERLRLSTAVADITLCADRFAAPRVRQFDLFREKSGDDVEWQAVLDRLCARLGSEAVHGLGLHADHRPEKSWTRLPCAAPSGPQGFPPVTSAGGLEGLSMTPAGTASQIKPSAERPLWLLPEPRLLPALPRCIHGPERLDSGWWEGLDAQRDYYVAETADCARLWVFRERVSDRWYLHGLWA